MRQAEQSPLSDAKPEKSKWLSSLVWIVVLWLFVRLIAEMDGISWKRAFWGVPVIFGIFPSTFFLLLAAFVSNYSLQKLFRWAALLVIPWSLVGTSAIILNFKNLEETNYLTALFQIISLLGVLGLAAVVRRASQRKEVNDE